MEKKIPYINLIKQSSKDRIEVFKAFKKIFATGNFILGDEVNKFEKKICNFLKIKNCIALNSGTDAIVLGLYLLGVRRGDEVITPPNSFIASTAAIVHLGAIPVFVDVNEDQNIDPNDIEKKITKKTKVIMPVHLSGRSCDMNKIKKISKNYNIPILEDAAQAIGTKYRNKFVGTFGDIGCFSAHPLKNLNAIGDAGYLITNNSKYAKLAKRLRNHGIEKRNNILNFGYVSRMDNLQAAVLNLRFKNLKKIIKKRRHNSSLYFKYLKNLKRITLPVEKKYEYNTYHTFVIIAEKRNELKKYLEQKGISTAIHYPNLIFEQPAYIKKFKKINFNSFPKAKYLNRRILTLPINQFLSSKQIERVCKEIIEFYKF